MLIGQADLDRPITGCQPSIHVGVKTIKGIILPRATGPLAMGIRVESLMG